MAKIKINDLPNNAANGITPGDLAKITGGTEQFSLNFEEIKDIYSSTSRISPRNLSRLIGY